MKIIALVVDKDNENIRLDAFLVNNLKGRSRSSIQKLIGEENVLVNGKVVTKNYKCNYLDQIEINITKPKELDVIKQDIPLDIVYEDDDLMVINKPKNMVVHPGNGNHEDTLVNAILFHCKDSLSGINGVIRPGIVHRIDKDTSGLLIVAKNDTAHIHLASQIKEHSFTREYEAVIYGNIKEDFGTIDAPIGRSKNDRKKMCVTRNNSKEAVTHFTVLGRYNNFTHVRLKLETGRTHQIRVHMAHIGHPVVGDVLYGPKKVITQTNGQCLHAKSIGFIHPRTNDSMFFESKLPLYFEKYLNYLSNKQ